MSYCQSHAHVYILVCAFSYGFIYRTAILNVKIMWTARTLPGTVRLQRFSPPAASSSLAATILSPAMGVLLVGVSALVARLWLVMHTGQLLWGLVTM